MRSRAEGAHPTDYHQLPGGEPGCRRPAGGHAGDAVGGVPGGRWAHGPCCSGVGKDQDTPWSAQATRRGGRISGIFSLVRELTLEETHENDEERPGNDAVPVTGLERWGCSEKYSLYQPCVIDGVRSDKRLHPDSMHL